MPTSDPDLLARCAALRRLDAELLRDVLGLDAEAAAALLAAPEVEPLPGGHHLRPDAAEQARARLLAAGPAAEAEVHRLAFLHYLGRMRRGQPPALADEDECMHHLGVLFVPLLTRMAWGEMRRYAAQAARARPQRPESIQRLKLLTGYAAVHVRRYERAERLLGGLLAQDPLPADVRIRALKALADAAWFRSRYEEARDRYDGLHRAARAAGDRAYEGLALLNRALVAHELESYEQALADCEQSLAIFRAIGDRTREAHALYHSALFSLHLGRWEAAQERCAEAQDRFAQLGLPAYLGFTSWCQGLLAQIFGADEASERAYLRSLELAEAPGSEQLSLALDTHVNLGVLYASGGRHAEALEQFGRALACAARLDRPHQICLIHFRRGQVLERMGRPGLAWLSYRRAVRLIEVMGSAIDAEDVKISLLGTTQQLYEAAVLLCVALYRRRGDERWAERALAYVERARSRAFLDSLARRSAAGQMDPPAAAPARLAEIQAALPEDALLIEYFTTGVAPRGEHLVARLPPASTRLREMLVLRPSVTGFAISRGGCVAFFPETDPNRLRPQAGDRQPGRHLLLGATPARLYAELVAPAAPMLAGRRLLYLVPHGPLHYIPFAALRTPQGQALIDLDPAEDGSGLALAQAPSATILIRSCLAARPRQAGQPLALGFDDAGGERPLRFAEAEAEHVARMLGGSALTGPAPKRGPLGEAGPRARCLHIAGHALFTPRDPLGSWLLLGDGDRLSARDIIGGLEIGAELVTLSSCTSGVNHIVPGDELLGLPRALLYAGAPTVVCTRWEAIDIVALLVMDRFYAELPRRSPASALRAAQVAVRELTLGQLAEQLDGWRQAGGSLARALGDQDLLQELAAISRGAADDAATAVAPDPAPPHDPDARPFAAPLLWAPFMVIGRG